MTAPAENDLRRLLEAYRDAPDGFIVVGKSQGRLGLVVVNGEVVHSAMAGWREARAKEGRAESGESDST